LIQDQRKEFNLKIGDKAYFISDWYGKPDVVTILGECDEGQGYIAYCSSFAKDKDNVEDAGRIHTCNGFLTKTKKDARQESLRILHIRRKEMALEQTKISKIIQYIDYVVSKKGKYPHE
jgi:hypothetical protein